MDNVGINLTTHMELTKTQASVHFLDWIIWSEKNHFKSGSHLVAAHIKEHGIRKIFIFVSFLSFSLTSSAILLLRHSFAGIRTFFFGIPMQTEDKQLLENCLEFQQQTGTVETSSLIDSATTIFLAFLLWDSHLFRQLLKP